MLEKGNYYQQFLMYLENQYRPKCIYMLLCSKSSYI